MSDTPMNATIAARPSSTRAMCVPDEVVSEVVDCGAGDVALATALLVVLVLEVWSLEAEAEAEDAVVPVLAAAFFWKASAVWSPLSGGLMERTIPDLQFVPTEEKNLRE